MRIHLLVVLVCGLLFLACPPDPAAAMPELVPPDWQDGEVARYDIVRGDTVLFRSVVSLRFDEEFGTPTAVVTTTVEPDQARQFFYDSSEVVFHRDSLRPIRSYRSLETDIGLFDIEARYDGDIVTVRRQSIEGIEEKRLKVDGPAFDNEMVSTMLRSVPLSPATEFTIRSFVPIDLRALHLDVTVLGTKLVPTGVGELMCREVLVETPNREVRFWYELEEPHRMAGMTDPTNGTEMRLAGYTAAEDDSLGVRPALP